MAGYEQPVLQQPVENVQSTSRFIFWENAILFECKYRLSFSIRLSRGKKKGRALPSSSARSMELQPMQPLLENI